MSRAPVDLKQLAVRRDPAHAPAAKPRPRRLHLLTRYVLPGLILVGLAGLVAWGTRDHLFPGRPVSVVPPITTRAVVQNEGAPLFQAAGWVEPRPAPIVVSALVEGVVDQVFVVEGQRVQAGEKLAILNPADAQLALQAAEIELELRQGEVENTTALVRTAKLNLEQPAHLRAAVGEAEALLAQKETELAALPFQLAIARTRHDLAQGTLRAKQQAGGALPVIELERARAEVQTTSAQIKELEARTESLRKEVTAQRLKRDALQQRLELKTDETRALAEAEGKLKKATAACKQAEVGVAQVRLRLERHTVKAPVAGQVLAVLARPGMRLVGLAPGSLHDASTVITMYEPAKLQIRADVRLENVPQVVPGQKVKIETAAVRGAPLEGEVLGMTSQADLQKNTLQVKVAVTTPPPTLRPDMLVQVTFLASPTVDKRDSKIQRLRVFIPRQLVESSGDGNTIWLADRGSGVARLRSVKLGQSSGELVEIVEGLRLTDRVISSGREGLSEGQRIAITGEDQTRAAQR